MAATYRIYRRTDKGIGNDPEGFALEFVGSAVGNDAKQAMRRWFSDGTLRPFNGNDTFVLIPDSAHHELKPSVETQTRLSFS